MRDVFLLAMSHGKDGREITRGASTFPANWDAVLNATHSVIKASCVFCRNFFGMRKFWRGRCAEGPLGCLNWSLFWLYFIAYFCVVVSNMGPQVISVQGKNKKKKKIQLGRRSNWWCRLFPKHWCDRCSHDLLFVNTDPDVGPACSEIFASCCSASIRFHLVVHCHSSCSAVLLHRMKEEVSGASKARTTSRWSQSSGSKSTPPIRLYLSMWNQSSTVLCIGHVPAQRHSSPSKANSRNRCVGILGVNPLRILLNCSTVRQEWWVNTRWCPTLILVSVPLVFLGQGEMNSKDSYEACSKLSTAGFAVKWRRIGGQHKILLKKDMKIGHCWTYSFPAIIFNLTLAWLLWRWTGKRAL